MRLTRSTHDYQNMKRHIFIYITILCATFSFAQQRVTSHVDPRIGSEGLGRVFVGPSCPFGMVKPGPDCGVSNNAGWAPMPSSVSGFSQLHVSGTGGGPKYGNILIVPLMSENEKEISTSLFRTAEQIELGYYGCSFSNGIRAEVTAAERAAIYRFHNAKTARFDLEHFLGKNPVPKAREAQQFEGCEMKEENDSVTIGWQCISGGWNNGAPYTVYFYAKKKAECIDGEELLLLKIGISFVSIAKAKENLKDDIPDWDFEAVREECVSKWEAALGKVRLGESTPDAVCKQFYTALYHTMLMPVDRTKDNGLYDDYYAIWDTYRTNTPLITLLDPEREKAIVNSLLDIYKKDGYMPDARSGNSNGRTQGGSNAEIVVADALAKGLGIDYKLALKAMLKDATVAPKDDEAEGRGGLKEYNELGYIPYGIARCCNRTVEYSFCDWAIAQVAKHVGEKKLHDKYMKQSERWKNLWRHDYVHDDTRGFIMPRNSDGAWLDSVPYGHSRQQDRKFLYTPDTSYEGPWYCAWWDCAFYEASSWEYSLSIPHDIPGLIAKCGGEEEFEKRLDTFFEHGYYNVANEPSFLTPMLYHWIGKPDKSSELIHKIVRENYSNLPNGLPGNDDGGAMSAWYAFHAMGIYPNAGHGYYLIHTPIVSECSIRLDNGKTFAVKRSSNIDAPTYNGMRLNDWRITHQQILEGGVLTVPAPLYYRFTYKLHGQTRKFDVSIRKSGESIVMNWGIQRNLKYWTGSYTMSAEAIQHATSLSYLQPIDGQHATLGNNELFALMSKDVLKQIKTTGQCSWCNTIFKLAKDDDGGKALLHLVDEKEGAEMWVMDNMDLPLIVEMRNNPVEINWKVEELQ